MQFCATSPPCDPQRYCNALNYLHLNHLKPFENAVCGSRSVDGPWPPIVAACIYVLKY